MVRWTIVGVTRDARDDLWIVTIQFRECLSDAGTDVPRGAGERQESEFQCGERFADLGMMDADTVLYQPELPSQGVDGFCGRW
mmetsp:Transcript_3367/g.3401  ORF Transcript_3367/g.3401 Transcript_3367/m.3401 type:complete len:83 (+) Transcript_3367:376-624(+)